MFFLLLQVIFGNIEEICIIPLYSFAFSLSIFCSPSWQVLRQADPQGPAARQGVQAEGHLRGDDLQPGGARDQHRDLSLSGGTWLRGAAQRPQLAVPQVLSAVQVRRFQDRQGLYRLAVNRLYV